MKCFDSFADKLIAVLMWNTEVEIDVHLYLGKIEMEGEEYVLLIKKRAGALQLYLDNDGDIMNFPMGRGPSG